MAETKMTVCQVLFTLMHGGAEVLAMRIARRLSGQFRMTFACLEGLGPLGEQLRSDGFDVQVFARRPGIDWRCASRLADLFHREHVDVVHAHQYGPFFYSALARHFGAHMPIVLTEHGRAFPDNTSRTHHFANRLLLRRRDRVAGVGCEVRRGLIDKEGFSAGRVQVIYNGIDLSPYAGEAPDREVVRREIGVAPGDLLVAHVARLEAIKDHGTAIRTLEQLIRIQGNARLVIVGDGPEAGRIEAMIRDRGLEAHVRMLGHRLDVPKLLRAADLALLTSVSEGIPLSLIEAMAAGLPVVSTRVGGVPEVVEEGRTGFLAPAGDSVTLAGHLALLAGDRDLRTRLGRAGRERVWAMFSEDQMVASYIQIYREVAGQRAVGDERQPQTLASQGA
ncbi:glycosyltransferase [Singulisphaera acidiphila]|uniref:Glycosyltransferase n=1 Tax=Singulisphaera acidiphila (strain ATCC BAA-1392 / DSM 18658 / VKM B-2454 / MOB10) TaxID=886293 RepID=L0DDP1_SINAD|nr:glycosyltransferase [Singulisphaera acidiphila]AGA26786.1 glycosyltransferase [Singulisphaera acidiphila DSM 18658]